MISNKKRINYIFSEAVRDYDRNVCMGDKGQLDDEQITVRRSDRKMDPVKQYNLGELKCCICKVRFREDVDIKFYDGATVCSIKCFKKFN